VKVDVPEVTFAVPSTVLASLGHLLPLLGEKAALIAL